VLHLVKHHPALFREAYPERWINNIYFDTHELDSYADNVSGIAERMKVRLRWYGEFFGKIKESVLELKIKQGFVGTKEHYNFGSFEFDIGFNDKKFLEVLKSSYLTEDVQRRIKNLKPALFNRYLRKYYISANGRYRITIDTDMAYFCPQRLHNSFREKHIDNDKIIVELKYSEPDDREANRVSAFFPFRVTKSSKYIQGIDKFL
jgi:SPX domain protein involved in polyphosphate accumulation